MSPNKVPSAHREPHGGVPTTGGGHLATLDSMMTTLVHVVTLTPLGSSRILILAS